MDWQGESRAELNTKGGQAGGVWPSVGFQADARKVEDSLGEQQKNEERDEMAGAAQEPKGSHKQHGEAAGETLQKHLDTKARPSWGTFQHEKEAKSHEILLGQTQTSPWFIAQVVSSAESALIAEMAWPALMCWVGMEASPDGPQPRCWSCCSHLAEDPRSIPWYASFQTLQIYSFRSLCSIHWWNWPVGSSSSVTHSISTTVIARVTYSCALECACEAVWRRKGWFAWWCRLKVLGFQPPRRFGQ